MADRILKAAAAVLAALLVLGVFTFAGPCVHDDGTAAMCQPSQTGIAVAGVVALVAALAAFFTRDRVSGAALVVAAVAGAFAAFAPGNVLPLCLMATMRCHVVMQPFALFVGALLFIVALVAAIRSFRAKG